MGEVIAGILLGAVIETSVFYLARWFRHPLQHRVRVAAVVSFWRGWGVSPRGLNRIAVPFAVLNVVTGVCVAVVSPMTVLYSRASIARPTFIAVFAVGSGLMVFSVTMALFVYLFGRPRRLLLCAPRTASNAEVLQALGLDPGRSDE